MGISPLATRISGEIAALIAMGKITPGTHLSTQALADQFGVSRSPVRDALELLAERQVLELRANKGFFSRPPAKRVRGRNGDDLLDDSSVYRQLTEDWLRDRIPAEVTEQFLKERYSLTKAQVTEVLMRADREGWAERKNGYGWRFLPVAKTPEAFEQVYRFRMLIEPAAMLEPTFRLDKKVLAAQRRAQQEMLDSEIERFPAEWLLNAGSVFHEELIKLSGNPFFHQSLVRINRTRRLLEYRSRPGRDRLYLQCSEHLEILDLLDRNEILEATYRMRRHLAGALDRKKPGTWQRESELGTYTSKK